MNFQALGEKKSLEDGVSLDARVTSGLVAHISNILGVSVNCQGVRRIYVKCFVMVFVTVFL